MEEQGLNLTGAIKDASGNVIDFSTPTSKKAPAVVKKKSKQGLTSGLNSALEPTKSSLVSPSLKGSIVTGPNASFNQKFKAEETEEISAMDDLWNTLKGAGSKAFSALARIPDYYQTASLDLLMYATGMSDDFNKLPSSDKKEIRNALIGITKAGAKASGTATQIIPATSEISGMAADFLNKKSEQIYKKTRQENIDVLDELEKFKNNPNADSIQKILYQGLKTTVESVPYMAIGAVSLPLLGVASAAEKRQEELEKTGGSLGVGYLLNSGISGSAEMVFEGATQKILGKAAKAAFGNKAAADAVAEGFVKSVAKDFGEEGLSEGATTFIQEVSDKVTKGEDVDWWQVAHNVANSTILGGISGAGISGAGATIGKARGYIAKSIMPVDDKKKIEGNINTIESLNMQMGDDVSPDANKVIKQKIKELNDENAMILSKNEAIAEKLTEEELKEVFTINDELYKNFKSADALISDPNMDDDAKDLLLKDLKKKHDNLKQERNAISEQAASQVLIQPEAGVSGKVEKGKPQAELKVTTKEGKGKEVEQEFVYETNPDTKDQWIGDFEVIDNRGGKAGLEINGREGNWYVKNNVTGREVMAKSKPEAQSIIDNADDYDFGQGETFTSPKQVTSEQEDWNKKSYMDKRNFIINELPKKTVNYKEIKKIGPGGLVLNNPSSLESPIFRSAKKIYDDISSGKPIQNVPYVNEDMELLDGINRISAQLAAGIEDIEVVVLDDTARDYVDKRMQELNDKYKNEDLQTKESRPKNEEQATKKGPQSEQERAQQSARNVSKRGEIKSSLERIKDAGVLKSAITGKDGITQKELDAQMALTDAMADVWKETTGNDNFYETFFDDIKEGDTNTLNQLGGLLFQNIELPKRPLTSVSLAVFNLPEFRKMEGQMVAINSIKDLARTRGKQIEKDLMQSTLEYEKYKDQKKISYDEFKNDVELQVMKLEKIRTSSYSSYGINNLGDDSIYGGSGRAWTLIYNSPIDHGEYGHFSGDFSSSAISKGTLTSGSMWGWNDWEIKQIPGTEQYVAIDKSMPENTSPDQISNYIGTAGTKEQVEKWIEDREEFQDKDINIGLFGHTRVWMGDKDKKYYLAELQSDYFQKNDPNDLYASQIDRKKAIEYANDKYDENDLVNDVEKIGEDLGVGDVLKIEKVPGNLELYLKQDGEFIKVLSKTHVNNSDNFTAIIKLDLLKTFDDILNAREPYPIEFAKAWTTLNAPGIARKSWQIFDNYKVESYNKRRDYSNEYIKNEIEKIKNSEKGVSMLRQFIASQKIHELRLMRESLRNAAQEGAETLLFPTPYTLAVIEGYVNKADETGAPYEIVSGDSDQLYQGDIINYGGTEMVVVDQNGRNIIVAPRDEVYIYDYYEFIDQETNNYLDEVKGEIRRSVSDINNITEVDIDKITFEDLPWVADGIEYIFLNNIDQSENGSVSFNDLEDRISDAIRDRLYSTDVSDLFWGDDLYSDGDQTYYMIERRGSVETLNQPDQYESGTSKEDFESELGSAQKTVVNKYKELNKEFKKMRPDAKVVTDDNGMEWIETKLTPEDAVNPVIAFQEEGGKVKGAVDFSNDNKASFYMFNGADISTLTHEVSGHLGRRFLEQLSKVDEDFSKDYDKAMKWAGVKDNQWTVAAEEKFARGLERYLREGKAPTKALTSVFENLKTWLSNIYKKIKGSSLDVKLTPEIREVFGNILGGRTEAKPAQAPAKKVSVKETAFTKLDKGADAEVKFDEIYKRRFEKTKDKLKSFVSAKTALLKTDAYAAATRQQRLDMLSYLRNKYKLKMDTNLEATRAEIEVSKQFTSEEIVATIKDYLGRAIQEGVKRGTKRTKETLQEKRKSEKKVLSDTIEKIKKMINKSSLKGAQARAILNGLKLNLSNEKTMAVYMERIDKIIKNVKYAEKLNEANDTKRKIKGLISERNIAAQNQLARDFLTLSPDLSKNIDKYIEVANSVYESITRGQRTPAVIADVEAYVSKAQAYEKELIKNTLDDIAEKAKAKLLKENQNLVDAGVLSKDMTLDQINEYLYSINSLGEDNIEQAKEKKKVLLEQAKNVFESLAPIAEMMVSEGIDPFTGEDIEIDKYTKELINRLLDVDLDKLEGPEAYRLANSLQEFLVNGVVDDLEARLTAYEAIKGAERLEKKGVKSTISTSEFQPIAFISKLWDINIKPLKSLLAKTFNGRIAGTEIFDSSGLRGVSLGAAKAKKISSIIISKYDKMYKDEKPNGKAFDDASNTYERGIFAFLSRNINRATPEQTKKEFDRRMNLISETIDNLRDTNKTDLVAMADVIESIYSKIEDSKSIEDVAKFIDPINQEAVNYWIEEFKKYYPEIKSVARTTYNTILEDDIDYTPDVFFKIIPDEKKYDPSGVFKMASSLVKTKRSGSLLENQRTPSIRDVKDPTSNNLGVSFDFDLNMANTFQKTLVDVKTAPSILYFKNFVNSAAFSRMVPDSEVRKTLKNRMGSYADSIREKDGSNYEDIVREADAIARRISRYSTQRALGSVSNIVKQTLPIFVNTFVNLNGSGDISIFRKGLSSMSDPDIQKAIDESGYPIANRGLESQTSLDSADKLLKKANLNNKKSILETIDELGQKRLESFLKNPDVYAARAAWISYYLQDQKSKGVDIDRIDWSKPLDSKSANYAEDMVDLQQNTSESSSMGKLFSSKNPGTSLVRQFLFGYASFVMNQKDKVFTDVGILFSNSNKQEKQVAAKSLVSTVAEIAAFEFVSMALSEAIMVIASSIVGGGDDEKKEDMVDRFNRMFKRSYTNMTASLLSPAPLLDKVTIYLLNQGITGTGNLLNIDNGPRNRREKTKDEKFFYEDKGYATSPVTSALNYLGGAPGVSLRAGMSVFNNIQRIFSSQYQDVFGNNVKFSDRDKSIIAAAFVFQILAAGNLLPSEAERIANSVVIEVEKKARKSKQ